MSFGGFGGFGQNNSSQSTTGFGGFGSTNNNNNNQSTGFGSSNANTGLGSSTPTSNPFGGFGSNQNSGGFGSNNNTSSLFGNNKSTFGAPASTGSSMFGSTNAGTSGGFGSGGFGSNNNTSSGFNFGQKSSTFGGGASSGATLFGSGSNTNTTTTGFGSGSNQSAGFGGSGTALNQPVPPSEGTGSTPFSAYTEKDGNSTTTNHFQSITFMQPYQKYSFEELRLADYNAGRKNASSGQAGAFGQSTGFGGFGQQNTSFGQSSSNPFGGTSSSSTPFGGTSTAGGFGSNNTGGSLFGANKPATGGLFGSTQQQTSAPSSGGLFGNTTGGSTGFGGFGNNNNNSNTNNTTGGSLFGNQSNTSKPGGLFGSSNTASGGTGFGGFGNQNTTNSGGGLFGNANNTTSNAGGGMFGAQTSQPQQSGGLFGASSTQKPAFGGFGTAASQPQQSGGLFGNSNTNTGGGLFGNTAQPQQQSGGLFGNNNQAQGGGGLFGSTQNQQSGGLFGAKPAAATGFGNSNTQQANTGGLFGGGNNQQGSSLFGNSQQNKPASGGLFGSSFGNNQNQQQGGNSLFGNSNGGSLFGGSQQNQQPQQPQGLRASLLEGNPYGASSIWSGLPPATSENKGPLVTPLSASQKLKESQSRSSLRHSPVSRLYSTPPRRTGYGFSYSTYGTPSSASSTPGTGSVYGRGFTGGSFGRSVTKSFSSSNLRQQFSNEGEGVLSPGALGPGSSRYSSGSIRRLTIDRSLKTDLFARSPLALPPATTNLNGATEADKPRSDLSEQPQKLKKRVSFDQASREPNGSTLNGITGALVRTEDDDTESAIEDSGILRSTKRQSNGTSSSSDNESTRGKELAAVPEDRVTDTAVSNMRMPHDAPAAVDPKPGEYWMKPSRAELSKMPREKLQGFKGFTVGRQGCGSVTFDEPADLTKVPLDDLYGKIVDIGVRSITVYGDASTKPPPGTGLNVPSTLRLENSWPRARGKPSSATSGPVFDKHVRRLREVKGTEYVNYETQSGIWTFRVPHYTRYGLDYDEEDDAQSELSSPPDDLETPKTSSRRYPGEDNTPDQDSSGLEDDTFGYKKSLPGTFGQQAAFDDINDAQQETFLEGGSIASPSDVSYQSDMEASDDEMDMAGSFPQPDSATGEENNLSVSRIGTPGKRALDLNGDWAEQLQRTISPRKQDREALRGLQSQILIDIEAPPEPTRKLNPKSDFRTSIDVMNSLFGQHEERMSAAKNKQNVGGKGFEWPYSKRAKAFDVSELTHLDRAWHSTFKPEWTTLGQLIYSDHQPGENTTEPWNWGARPLFPNGENEDLKVASLCGTNLESLAAQQIRSPNTDVQLSNGVPYARIKKADFDNFAERVQEWETLNGASKVTKNEFLIWKCAHILFDDYDDKFTAGFSEEQKKQFDHRIRRDRFQELWELLILEKNITATDDHPSASPEELAVYCLSLRDIEGACRNLIDNGDYHLATLVSDIGNSDLSFRENIRNQLTKWRDQGVISEMTDEIRTIYELLAGNTTICEGRTKGSSENYASTFAISERWDLDWLQAFGLVLFYGILQDEPIEAAVAKYAASLESQHETAFPSLENLGDPTRIIPSDAESPFWVLLKMYAKMKGHGTGQPVILPQAITLSRPFDCRLTFQLHHALVAHQDDMPELQLDSDRADQLAMELAFQYSATGFYPDAIYASLFISKDAEREAAIRDILFRHAAVLPERVPGIVEGQESLEERVLHDIFKIPQSWRCEAKALYFRAANHHEVEYLYLLAAGLLNEAHDTAIRRVAPRLLINKDYKELSNLLNLFDQQTGPGKPSILTLLPDFGHGLGVYADFFSLLHAGFFNEGYIPKEKSQDLLHLCSRLQKSLHAMEAHIKKRQKQHTSTQAGANVKTGEINLLSAGGSSDEALELVACKEMGTIVAGSMMRSQTHKSLLNLPMLSSTRSMHTKAISMDYYRGIMSGAR